MITVIRPDHTDKMEAKAKTLEVRRSGTGFLVKSNSKKERWYEATRLRCECKGFRFRGICSHVLAVRAKGKTAPATRYPFCTICGCDIVPEPGQKTEDAVLDHIDAPAHLARIGPEPKYGATESLSRGRLRLKRRRNAGT